MRFLRSVFVSPETERNIVILGLFVPEIALEALKNNLKTYVPLFISFLNNSYFSLTRLRVMVGYDFVKVAPYSFICSNVFERSSISIYVLAKLRLLCSDLLY